MMSCRVSFVRGKGALRPLLPLQSLSPRRLWYSTSPTSGSSATETMLPLPAVNALNAALKIVPQSDNEEEWAQFIRKASDLLTPAGGHLLASELRMQRLESQGKKPDINMYNQAIQARAMQGDIARMMEIFRELKQEGLTPNDETYMHVQTAGIVGVSFQDCWDVYEEIKNSNIIKSPFHYINAVHACGFHEEPDYLEQITRDYEASEVSEMMFAAHFANQLAPLKKAPQTPAEVEERLAYFKKAYERIGLPADRAPKTDEEAARLLAIIERGGQQLIPEYNRMFYAAVAEAYARSGCPIEALDTLDLMKSKGMELRIEDMGNVFTVWAAYNSKEVPSHLMPLVVHFVQEGDEAKKTSKETSEETRKKALLNSAPEKPVDPQVTALFNEWANWLRTKQD